MVRAERLTALGLLARVTVALRVLGVFNGSEAVRAADGVAVQSSVHPAGRLTRCARHKDDLAEFWLHVVVLLSALRPHVHGKIEGCLISIKTLPVGKKQILNARDGFIYSYTYSHMLRQRLNPRRLIVFPNFQRTRNPKSSKLYFSRVPEMEGEVPTCPYTIKEHRSEIIEVGRVAEKPSLSICPGDN